MGTQGPAIRWWSRVGAPGLRICAIFGALSAGGAPAGGKDLTADPLARGKALFLRTWEPDDRRGHGGDGLGPVFNDRSCVACHNRGGPGGAGLAGKNVDIVSVFFNPRVRKGEDRAALKPDLDEMAAIHPGFANSRSVVLHRFGSLPSYENWRRQLLVSDPPAASRRSKAATAEDPLPLDRPATLPKEARRGSFTLQRTQRNSTALFGAGLIDAIPDAAIEAHANPLPPPHEFKPRLDLIPPSAVGKPPDPDANAPWRRPKVHGRVSRLKDGRVGRFGWKAQLASLKEFVETACSVELGLEVPGHPQAADPIGYDRPASGLDLTQSECDDLVAYIRSLPAPVERKPSNALGKKVFASIGCADCHIPTLGGVEGIYSDLLLHDLGDGLEDTGGYGTFTAPSPGEAIPEPDTPATGGTEVSAVQGLAKPTLGAGRREWRTPPLWGVRDSAPYMHDGRAMTLEAAIELHQADGLDAANRYRALPLAKQTQLLQFLKSLAAPRQIARRGTR